MDLLAESISVFCALSLLPASHPETLPHGMSQEEAVKTTLTYIVLVLQVLGQRRAHEHATLGRVGTEVCLAALSAGRGDSRVEFHCNTYQSVSHGELTTMQQQRHVLLISRKKEILSRPSTLVEKAPPATSQLAPRWSLNRSAEP